MTDGPPKLTATQIGGAVFAALAVPWAGSVIGSTTGTTGTLVGTMLGSILPVLAGWMYLRGVHHAKSGLARVPWRKAKPWHVLAAAPVVAAVVFVVGVAGVSGVEAKVLHRSLSAAVTGSHGNGGTTLGAALGSAPRPAPSLLGPSEASSVPSASTAMPSSAVTAPAGPSSVIPVSPSPAASSPASPAAPATIPASPANTPAGAVDPQPPAPTGAQQ